MKMLQSSAIGVLDFGARAASILVIMKCAVIYGGAEGVATFGQFHNFFTMCLLLGSGIFNNATLRYTVKYRNDDKNRFSFWNTVITLSLLISAFIAIVLQFFPNELIKDLAGAGISKNIFVTSSLLLVPASLLVFFLSVSNGLERPKLLLTTRLVSTICLFLLFTIILLIAGLEWALLSITLAPALAALICVFIFQKNNIFKTSDIKLSLNKAHIKSLSSFAMIALVSAGSMPLVMLLSRARILDKLGAEQLGNWEGAFRIGDQYLVLITSVLSIYFLPRFARANKSLPRVVKSAFIFALLASVLCGGFIYLLRSPIVEILLDPNFSLTKELLGVQILVSIAKICSWVFAFVMVMKNQHLLYILGEFGASLILIVLIYIFSDRSIYWVNYAFLITYLIYFSYCVLAYSFTKKQRLNDVSA